MILYLIGAALYWFSVVYTLFLIARVILDWARFFAPRWTPRGILLVLANVVYAATDPPIRLLRRFIPPLRLGGVALDVGFLVVFLAVTIVGRVGIALMYSAM